MALHAGLQNLADRVRFSAPLPNAVIAQLVERLICNQDVRGSSPRGGTI